MSIKLRAIIVDDEELAREELIELLSKYSEIDIVGESDSVDTAVKAINSLQPDIIFLDIQMPGKTGFDLLDEIETDATIIFVTAYDEYAIKAFEVNAIDYLIKPVYPSRLAKTIQRMLKPEEKDNSQNIFDYEDLIFVKTSNKVRFVKIREIVGISSAREYTEIYTDDGQKALILKPMNEWEERLPSNHFLRIHRTNIINVNHIEKITDSLKNAHDVYIKGVKEPFGMSQRYYSKIKKRLQ